ncbi:MAG: hypothetical protein ACTS8Y_00910 [Arsenophonus sp. ER-EMS1-MAG3]
MQQSTLIIKTNNLRWSITYFCFAIFIFQDISGYFRIASTVTRAKYFLHCRYAMQIMHF